MASGMTKDDLQQPSTDAEEPIHALQAELAETNRGLIALSWELEQRIDERTAQLRAAHDELQRTNAELMQLTLDLEDRVVQRTESEEKFRNLAETASDAILSADSYGKIVYFNPAAEHIFSYSSTEIIGQPLTLLMPERFHDPHRQGMDRFLRTGEARVIGKTVELAARRKNGSEFPIELALSSWTTREGTFFTAIISEITERKKSEEALRDSEERLRMAVEGAEIGTWFWNIQQDEISWSAKFRTLFGLTSDAKLTYQVALDLIHPDDRQRVDRSVKNTLELAVPYDIEYRVVWPDSSVHWIAAKGRAHRNTEGVAVHMQGIVMDITERNRAEE